MAKKKFHGSYEGMSERRSQEMQDSAMIHEDRSAVANMPQNVIYKAYPKPSYGMADSGLNDTISGIDKQMSQDESGAKKHKSSRKY